MSPVTYLSYPKYMYGDEFSIKLRNLFLSLGNKTDKVGNDQERRNQKEILTPKTEVGKTK